MVLYVRQLKKKDLDCVGETLFLIGLPFLAKSDNTMVWKK